MAIFSVFFSILDHSAMAIQTVFPPFLLPPPLLSLIFSSSFLITLPPPLQTGHPERGSQRSGSGEILQAFDGDRGSKREWEDDADRVAALRHHRRFPAQRTHFLRPRPQTHRWKTRLSRGQQL